jgi:NAD(P)-dependent dehydrogenase (short-subunit alcohol dehydrogenase family)
MELDGKQVLITGAGSLGGIGADAAALFAEEGAEVLVSGRQAERGEQVVDGILRAGGKARFLLADLANLDDVARLADAAGDIDVLVNNAAGYRLESSLKLTPEDFAMMYDTNVRAPFFLVQKVAPRMLARRSGSIVNVSTMSASIGQQGGMSLYGSSKSSLESLTRYWAAEFAADNVRVNAVALGPTSSDNVTATMNSLGPGVVQNLLSSIPLGRWASTREVSRILLFLASERSSFITGSVLAADGGRTAV